MSTLPEDVMNKSNPFAALAGDITDMQKEAVEWLASAGLPQFAGATNLSAHPMGAMAAASALGMGMASQMFGLMAGSMAGAMQAASMLASETTGGHSAPFGLANPLNFDWATGSFDEKKEPDLVAPKPTATTEAPVVAKKANPAAGKAAPRAAVEQPVSAVPAAKPEPVVAKEPVAQPELVAIEAPEALVQETAPALGSVEPIMPEDFIKPKAIGKPEAPDDLKVISGVGPKLESVLNSLGVWTFEQIAAWTPHEIAWVDDYLQFKGRIERDGWIAQAAALAEKK